MSSEIQGSYHVAIEFEAFRFADIRRQTYSYERMFYEQFGEEAEALHVSWPWRLTVCWGNRTVVQYFHSPADDLRLQLGFIRDT